MRRLLALGLGCLASFTASGEDLLTIFDQAVVNDPTVREAEYTRKATREARPQAWAAYLPQINGSYNKGESEGNRLTTRGDIIEDPNVPGSLILQPVADNSQLSPEFSGWSVELRQTIFSWQGLVGLKQSSRIAAQADADYGVAQQDLALRVSTRYFDVLAALDNVQAQQASLDAISRQLEQADKRFEVGLIAITDVQEARAARDTAAADLIAAKRQLATAQEFLREITDMQYASLSTPRGTMPLAIPEPADPQKWVEASMEQNLALTSSRLGAEIARDDVRTAFGGHLPTVELVVGKSHNESDDIATFPPAPGFPGGTAPNNLDSDTDKSITLQVQVPIWSSGGTHSRVKQQEYRWQAAKQRVERVSRETERTARDAYLGVMSEISRVQALQQALESSRTALKATEAGYDVGTRTAIDVLAARQALVQAFTNYSRSRYDYMLNVLRLKQSAGLLDRKALEDVNAWLENPPPPGNPAAVTPTPPAQ
ncbi:MAG TPA: TolC family outer membrane protein [Steroidobacteraceae bacterium]|nr:TolC family outer membrane protein [Steroidobacteraceae bacterium]